MRTLAFVAVGLAVVLVLFTTLGFAIYHDAALFWRDMATAGVYALISIAASLGSNRRRLQSS